MSWFEVITDRGRSLKMIVVRFECGELHVSVYGLHDGEAIAVLIDHMKNVAHLVADPDTCERVMLQHRYELASSATLSAVRIARLMAEEYKGQAASGQIGLTEEIGASYNEDCCRRSRAASFLS